jgi:hypothetical protein
MGASAQGWTAIGAASRNGAIGYRATASGDNNAAIFYGGYTAQDAWTRAWLDAEAGATLGTLGVKHLYAVPGPVDSFYTAREVANSKLLQHLFGVISDKTKLIVVVAHSSGSFVAHEMLSELAKLRPQLLGRVVYYNLDGGWILFSRGVAARLARLYCVFARNKKTQALSHNASGMQQCTKTWGANAASVEVDATNSGCAAAWCYHDTLVNTKPYNPNMYDLRRDYQLFDATHQVVDEYLRKTLPALQAILSR